MWTPIDEKLLLSQSRRTCQNIQIIFMSSRNKLRKKIKREIVSDSHEILLQIKYS
jgi:hypothetical protein